MQIFPSIRWYKLMSDDTKHCWEWERNGHAYILLLQVETGTNFPEGNLALSIKTKIHIFPLT